MMQRWYRRKEPTRIPVAVLIFSLFMVATILFYIQQIHEEKHPQPQVSVSRKRVSLNETAATLDRFTTCSSTVKYTGRKVDDHTPDSRGDRVISDKCDMFSGKWVFDNNSHPLYKEEDCPYVLDIACPLYGRKDLEYRSWRWQPHDCVLKRWNATEMWEKLRNKRMMFVGDSLNRGQWQSMVCLLQSVIPADKKSMSPLASLTVFRAEEYNATVEFNWAPLLVESNADDAESHRLDDRIIHPDSVSRHAAYWESADILVFNSYLWWRHLPVKLLWSTEENNVCEEFNNLGAMELAMETWANWVASKVDSLKKRVFFVTMSPTHLWSREWAPGSEGNCYGEKTPIDKDGFWGSGSDLPTMRMLERVLSRVSSKVSVLNITQLSEYRKDGHASIYRKFWENFSEKQLANPSSYADCMHWCLPGVPDVWNELLYNYL